MTNGLPGSVLFACDRNTIRSVMAEAIMKHLVGHRVYVDSAGVRLTGEEADPFAIAAMQEIGLDISGHRAKSFEDLPDDSVDLIITFSPQAQHRAVEFTRTIACALEYWPLMHPADVTGPREVRLEAYREARDTLFERIKARFPTPDRVV
ncbi:MAG: arsenate reductase ArsC [Rhodospirillaceae bacterium]|jgi:protein-tyrosine-phosphatase|nr:arsenate reductase ArsC [Rhodospirillaceae bacterium]MBT3807929.1 arsenate reductase ArsC [Rhodospirillaceae bacterium]MBT3929383.1 arsenate reductase ArsC [Rhodospirillaceae bacterium]MBT4773741.1 arsenate reductase ArsC [Rhodospirillaceae bacterium]MBT5357603.1 arsenate reductase ArsC [Rhodospirillaceae bacterium]